MTAFTPIETVPLPRPLHRFGTAFPLAVAEVYAGAYTARRGTVLDPLAHPFSAADAAERADRRGIARSPQPLGEWARRAVAAAPGQAEIVDALAAVAESALAGRPHALAMRDMYTSRCGTCRGPVVAEAFLWERDAPAPTKKAFRCSICAREGRALLIEPVTAEDEERARSVEPRGLPYWQLLERFAPGNGGPRERSEADLGESVAALYTPRNLAAVMATLRSVQTALPEGRARDLLLLCLVEVLIAGSKLNAVAGHGAALRIERGRARRGHASQFREVNVWLEYERTVRELATWLEGARPAGGDRSSSLGSSLRSSLRSEGPLPMGPHPLGPRPLGLTLDPGPADLVMFEAPGEDPLGGWALVASVLCLGVKPTRTTDPADARISARERTLRMTRQAFLEAHRLSRDGAPAIAYVPRADVGALAACALAGAGAGYRLRSVLYQPDALASGIGSGAAAVCEFDREVVRLRDQAPADAAAIEEAIRTGIRRAIVTRAEPVSSERAAAAALEELSTRGLLASIALARAGGVSELEVFMDHFRSAAADAHRSGIEKIEIGGEPAYVSSAGSADESPLDDRVEWSVWGLLAAAREIDTRAVLRRSYALFRGVETPDRELVERCLASYALQGEDGRWRLRDEDALVRRQREQTALALALVEAGHRMGFRVHVGRDLQRRALDEGRDGQVLADLMSADERAVSLGRYVRGASDALPFVDCIWYDRGRMVFLWQLDWTARLQRSVVGLGESIADDDRVFRFLAVPDERRDLLAFKLARSPRLDDLVRRRGWRFVKWGPLRAYATDAQASLAGLEPVIGLEPAVEQAGQQLAFRW